MRLSNKILKKRFKKFNEKYFKNILEEPKFLINGSRWTAGMFNSDMIITTSIRGKRRITELKNNKIRLSKYLLKNSKLLDTILLHEMIHYYGYLTSKDVDGTHGTFFMNYAKKINKDGYNIQKYFVE